MIRAVSPGTRTGSLIVAAAMSLPFCAFAPVLAAAVSQGGGAQAAPLVSGTVAADFPALRGLCDVRRATVTAGAASPTDLTPLTPTRVFDNLYFVGSGSVSSWAITTSRGIILIDALRNPDEVRAVIEPSMRSLGLDPAQVRYLIVTHGHGDHYGGVRYFVERYRPRVVMSEIDWRELEQPVLQLDAPHWGRPPARDITVRDGHRLRLGDTTVELRVTRTHTPGTISPIFRVRDGRRRHTLLLWGGTGFNFGPSVERLQSYAASAERLRALARGRGVEILISNHPRPDGSAARMAMLRQRIAGAPHPFVIGQSRVSAVLAALSTCARANADWITQQGRRN